MSNIIIHQLEISPFCDKVRRALHFKGLDYSVVNVPMGELAKLKKKSAIGKVPVLEIDGEFIADSSTICRELDRRFPDKPLLPSDPNHAALANILEDWADESLYFFEMTMRFTWTYDRARWVTEILKYDNAVMRRLARPLVPYLTRKQGTLQGLAKRSEADILTELARHITSLEAILNSNGDYLVGDSLSLADISVLAQCECIAGSSKGLPLIEQAPKLMTWMQRIEEQTGGPATR
ncbi:glutathione S-transferase family protein [Zhongshania sp.]|uniref:glutathione S-transferase family protein n=1 Tax=Zhongshania sp. TaxID=1971902 RepID=UPI00356257B2